MAENKNDQVVIAIFDSEDFANYGVNLLKRWDNATDEIKLGEIGIISKKGDKIKTQMPHKTGGGAKVGAVVGVIAAVLTGGASWIVAGLGGSAIGAVTGSFFKKSLNLTKDEIQALGKQLDEGKVAVIVTCDAHEVEETRKHLYQYGGVVNDYTIPEEALTEVADAIAAAPPAPEQQEAAAPEATPAASREEVETGAGADEKTA